MKIVTEMTMTQVKALIALGFKDIEKQYDAFYKAEHRLRTYLSKIGSIVRYFDKNKNKINQGKLDMLIDLCDCIQTEETQTYFFSLDTTYGAKLMNIMHCAEFISKHDPDEKHDFVEQMMQSVHFLFEQVKIVFAVEDAAE